MKQLLFFLVCAWAPFLSTAQITITNTASIPATCSNNGSVTVTISGGNPIYCFQVNGGNCQYDANTTHTFTGLSGGLQSITVSDGDFSVSTTVNVPGNYQVPAAFCSVQGCGVSTQVSGGQPPFQFAISQNGGAFSAPQSSPNFSPVSGNYCVRVFDGCNNFTQYCGAVNLSPLNFLAACCDGPTPADQICVQITDNETRTLGDPAFWCGGMPPYQFTATANGQTVASANGSFQLNTVCPGYTFTLTDACGNTATQTANCTEAVVGCVNCSTGTAQITGQHGNGPFMYYYKDAAGNWSPNPNGINNGNFTGLPMLPTGSYGVSYAFQVEDACGNVSETLWAKCLETEGTYDCATDMAFLSPTSDYFPVTINCLTCTPAASVSVNADEQAIFANLSGNDQFIITDACGASITKTCWPAPPTLELHRSCKSIEGFFQSNYVCNWNSPKPRNVMQGVTYKLSKLNSPNAIIANNATGFFDNLQPGATYIVMASHPDCGAASDTITLFQSGDFALDFKLSTTSFLNNAQCRGGYDLLTSLLPTPDIAPIYNLSGGNFLTGLPDTFLHLLPGNWMLASDNYCVSQNFTLPDWVPSINVNLPDCPNGGCVTLDGAKNETQWAEWGVSQGLNIVNKSDFYILDCPDFSGPTCQGSWDGSFCNLAPNSTHTVYLKPGAFTCPVDTAYFLLDPSGTARIDSVVLSSAVACTFGGTADLTATVFGGKSPIYMEVIDSVSGQIVLTIPDTDLDHVIEITNLQAGKNYVFRVGDDCGNSRDVTASVIALPGVVAQYAFTCPRKLRLYTSAIFGAFYTWKRANGSIVASGVNKWSIETNAPNNATSYQLEINYGVCPPYFIDLAVPGFANPDISFPFTDTLICASTGFDLAPQTAGGTHTFLWNNGANTASLFITQSGTYSVISTNENGCRDTATATVGLSPDILLSLTQTDILCAGKATGKISPVLSGGTPPFSYLWENSNTTASRDNLPSGNYAVTVTDAKQCTSTAQIILTEPPLLTTQATAEDVPCFGQNTGTAGATASGGTPPYAFQWPNGNIGNTATGLSAGNYTLVCTDSNGCTAATSASVEQPPALALQLEKQDVLCFGENNGNLQCVCTGGTGSLTYAWADGATTAQRTNLTAGTYTVTVTDANGCTITATENTQQPMPLSVVAIGQNIRCFGANDGQVSASASGGVGNYQFLWNNTLPGNVVEYLPSGNYSVIITDANGCTAATAITLTQPPLLTVAAQGNGIYCYNGDNGAVSAQAAGGTPAYSFLWDAGSQTAPALTSLSAGTYTVTATDTNGCTATTSATITAPPPLVGALQVGEIACFGEKTMAAITASGGIAPYGGTGNFDLPAGQHRFIIVDQNSCADTLEIDLSQPEFLVFSAIVGTHAGCHGHSKGTASAQFSGGTAPFQVLWNNGQTANIAQGLSAGLYSATVTDAKGCTATAQGEVEDFPPLQTAISTQKVTCFGEKNGAIIFDNIAGGAGAPYRLDGLGEITNGSVFENLAANTYDFRLIDQAGCSSDLLTEVTEPPLFGLQISPIVDIDLGESITLSPQLLGDPALPIKWQWSPDKALSCDSCPAPVARPFITTIYLVRAQDQNGCTAQDTVKVQVDKKCPVFVPNIFAPESGGDNAQLMFSAAPCVENVIRWAIFDRWGTLLFEQRDFSPNETNKSWDGRFRGRLLDTGVYVWMAQYVLVDGRTFVVSGDVMLSR